jgi:hypothetical protein
MDAARCRDGAKRLDGDIPVSPEYRRTDPKDRKFMHARVSPNTNGMPYD